MNKNEEIGRLKGQLICQNRIPGCKFIKNSEKETSHWDAIWQIDGEYFLVEYKNRLISSTKYGGDPLLEVHKTKSLNKIKEEYDKISGVFYVNFYTDNQFKVHNITDLNEEDNKEWLQQKHCPIHTDFELNKVKKTKNSFILPDNLAIYRGIIKNKIN